ncbi:helix-turn-helix transcriptional regulator [Actinocrispum sp. NPDC049592]|uniref:helix-turn-helix domain-containing protein n=1 Tax=Actinocrispum sp. NPDC049592 TaxID=3154835 RepID=UPI003425810B
MSGSGNLAERLRALRERHWTWLSLTQKQLADALGLSVASISAYETPDKAVVPTRRLNAYATFFATPRSVESEPYRVLPLTKLSEDELTAREQLLQDLIRLRDEPPPVAPAPDLPPATDGMWRFPVNHDVTIVCAQLPAKLHRNFVYANPENPDYVSLYTYADLDALFELHGHVRATNPANSVEYKAADRDFNPDDFTGHLIVLGGTDWNFLTEELLKTIDLPITSLERETEDDPGGFEAGGRSIVPKLLENGQLAEDVALFYRGPNPFNQKRTVTICYGMYGRGTYGVVRALTDPRFRDRNDGFLRERFGTSRQFFIISRVRVVKTQVLTPDWTLPESRLFEWQEGTRELAGRRGAG